jgi:hypothetical protein
LAILAAFGRLAPAQLPLDSQLAAEIAKIRAIDNHAHPVRPALGNDKDTDYHAMPVETLEPPTDPVRTREETLLMFDAWHELFGYDYSDRTPEHVRELQQRKKQLMQEKGAGYANWVFDRLEIDTMLANRVAMGPVAPPSYR